MKCLLYTSAITLFLLLNYVALVAQPCDTNTSCLTARDLGVLISSQEYHFEGCNQGMYSGPVIPEGGACMNMSNPTAWFKFTTDSMTNVVLFTFSSEVLKNPQYAIFSDCRTLIGCNPIDLFVQPNSVYWIAVTDRDSAIGTFSIDMNPLNSTDNCVNQQRLTVIKTSMGSDLEGPYKPCEEITFRYSTNFLKLGAQWLHSIFPVLSPCLGYSISQEPDSVSLPESSIAHWAWYPAGTVFWKSIDNSGNLIGVDSTGRLCMLGVPGCNPMIGGGNCSISGTSMPGGG